MKKKKTTNLAAANGLEAFLGTRITLFCLNYIYTGTLVKVHGDHVRLTAPAIVYETGAFTDTVWKDAQPLPHDLCVMRTAIESFGQVK